MSPTFEYGDMVIVERISGEQMMDEGDVVVYRQNGSRIVHRVVRVAGQNPPLYVTKGDANDAPDSVQLRQNEIEGRVLTSVPLAGWPTLILKKG